MATCSNCGAAVAENAVLCIDCGFDFRTGILRATAIRRSPSHVDFISSTVNDMGRILSGLIVIAVVAVILGKLTESIVNSAIVGGLLGLLWICISFSYRVRIHALRDSSSRPVIEVTRHYGLLRFSQRYEVSNYSSVWLQQSMENKKLSVVNVLLLLLCPGLFIVALLLGGSVANRDSQVVHYQIEVRADSGERLILLKASERFTRECSQSARMLGDVLKLPLHQNLQDL